MNRQRRRTLKSKLLQITLTTMLLTGAITLATVAWTNFATERERLLDIERHIRDSISSKAVTLTRSHALALRGMVADNAFSDVTALVSAAPRDDGDLVYGLFVAADSKPWVYVSPATQVAPAAEVPPERGLSELQLTSQQLAATQLSIRQVQRFGQTIHECIAPVTADDGELLGHIVYGFSNRRTEQAVATAGERSKRALFGALISSGVTGALSILLGIFWVMRSAARVVEPVTQLTSVANQITGGQRGIRAEIASGDEVELLASAFNQMLEANEDAMRRLEATTERALAADRLKSEFLANMSHEIRTPMNGVLGMTRLIRGMPLDGKLRRYIETIDSSGNALLTIINDILDFSKMEAGKYTLQSVPFQPGAVVQEVAELLASRAHDKSLELICRVDPAVPEHVLGDPDRFRQVLNNLVGNAVKFTDKGEVFVDVTVEQRTGEQVVLRVDVQDTGIGIAEADTNKLFEAFSQVDGTMVRKHGGTGLGLAISKRLVELMHGSLSVRSSLGVGSTFTFTVRFGLDQALATPVSRRDPLLSGKVLVLDTNPRWRQVIEEHLRAWGMEAEAAETGSAALQRLRAAAESPAPFTAAVLSSDVSDMVPAELVRSIRALPALRDLPLVLLTGLTQGSTLSEVDAELVAQLPKPLRFSELYNCLTGAWSGYLRKAATGSSRAAVARVSGPPILVVDDNDVNRLVAVEELERRGYSSEVASNGADALELIKTRSYLCVLMDCQMPVMDGYEATRRVRAFEAETGKTRTPIIALTAHALAGERDRVLEAGMDDFLSKPFRPSSLERLLRLHVKVERTQSDAAPDDTCGAARPRQASAPREHASSPKLPAALREKPAELSQAQAPGSRMEPLDLTPGIVRSEKLIRLFLDRVPTQLKDIHQALEAGNATELRGYAHKLKGSCLALAAERMAKTAERLQHQAESGELTGAAELAAELTQQYVAVERGLRRELSGNHPGVS